MGITRENRAYSFNYALPANQWVELEFKNEFEKTHLYVDGKLVDTIGTNTRAQIKATCMLPVEAPLAANPATRSRVMWTISAWAPLKTSTPPCPWTTPW